MNSVRNFEMPTFLLCNHEMSKVSLSDTKCCHLVGSNVDVLLLHSKRVTLTNSLSLISVSLGACEQIIISLCAGTID